MASQHYVDNKKLFAAMVKYKTAHIAYKKAQKKSNRKLKVPQIPEYIGECLLMIATRLSNKPNFASYTFREDMISDAIENCILYMHNFDPKKSQNPFAYFTQIIHYAFIRRIEREKKHSYIKYKYALHRAHQKEDYAVDQSENFNMKDSSWASYENVHDFIRSYEEKLDRARVARHAVDDDDESIVSFDILEDDTVAELGLDDPSERVEDTDDTDGEDEE